MKAFQRDNRTLHQKWQDHWETRHSIFTLTPTQLDVLGVAFFWISSSSIMFSAIMILIPHSTGSGQGWLQFFAFFVYIQCIWNWFLCARRQVSNVPKNLTTASLTLDWKHCAVCFMQTPPRSHHCKACKTCILKREHHCYFTRSCIGFYNQRHFIVLVFYIMVSCAFFISLVLQFFAHSHIGWNYFLPFAMFSAVFGNLGTGQFYLLAQVNLAALLGVLSLCYFLWELVIVYRGQTSFEAARGIVVYHGSSWRNFRSVFGPFWVLNFVFPTGFKQEGDGITWAAHKSFKGH